jgi:hypothetical protein
MDKRIFRQNIKRESQKKFGHSLKLEASLHGEHLCLTHFARKKKKKTYPNKTPKTLMLSNMQQKSTKGKKLKGRSERQPNQTLCGVRS